MSSNGIYFFAIGNLYHMVGLLDKSINQQVGGSFAVASLPLGAGAAAVAPPLPPLIPAHPGAVPYDQTFAMALQEMIEMGFEKTLASQALKASNNEVLEQALTSTH